MTEADLLAMRKVQAKATAGPWYTVESPWRASYYNKATGQHEILGTYIVAGNADPHAGTPILDSFEIEEWPAGESPDYLQSDADLGFCVSARTDWPRVTEWAIEVRRVLKKLVEYEEQSNVSLDSRNLADEARRLLGE